MFTNSDSKKNKEFFGKVKAARQQRAEEKEREKAAIFIQVGLSLSWSQQKLWRLYRYLSRNDDIDTLNFCRFVLLRVICITTFKSFFSPQLIHSDNFLVYINFKLKEWFLFSGVGEKVPLYFTTTIWDKVTKFLTQLKQKMC